MNTLGYVAIPSAGGLLGALAAGPLGAGIGLGLGIAGSLLAHARAKGPAPLPGAPPASPGGPRLPAGANVDAAQKATNLMLAATSTTVPHMQILVNGAPIPKEVAFAGPAKTWLSQFQSSIGVTPTGQLDPQTRAMLVLAAPNASSLPQVTILG
jgi:hypothetical protein